VRQISVLFKLRLFFLACFALSVLVIVAFYVLRMTREGGFVPGEQRVYLGLWQPGAPANMGRVEQFERDVRKKVAIIQFYYEWDQNLDHRLIKNVVQHKAVPLITWEPTTGCDEINDGLHDNDIRRWATTLATYRDETPILLRTMHEMNIPGYPWSVPDGGCTAESYVRAWRRIHLIFETSGATNVQHVWCPNVFWDELTEFDDMFPGDKYVDWIGLDGYNWGDNNWVSFGDLFGESYRRITSLSEKPLIIAEVGSNEAADGGKRKADWILDAFKNEIPNMPRVRAVVWFNQMWEGHAFPVGSTRHAERSFATAVDSHIYQSYWP
jgi:hypothetical protein